MAGYTAGEANEKEGFRMSGQIQTCFRRYEKKYFLTIEQYIAFRQMAAPMLRADDYGRYTLGNIYYDTDDYRLIRASLEKPVYKEKLRVRSYGVPGPEDNVFAEIKKKYDGVVYKRRITLPECDCAGFLGGIGRREDGGQISREIEYFQSFYHTVPKVYIAYDREAFQGIDNPDLRVTFDTGLRYRLDRLSLSEGDDGLPIIDTDMILMEIKIPGACPLWLCDILSSLGIRSVSFSKYGTCYTNHILKCKSGVTAVKKEMLLSA